MLGFKQLVVAVKIFFIATNKGKLLGFTRFISAFSSHENAFKIYILLLLKEASLVTGKKSVLLVKHSWEGRYQFPWYSAEVAFNLDHL